MMSDKKDIGDFGEESAAQYLRATGFEILHRNWRHGRYELDIVARKGGTIHFVEVKCRKSGGLTVPEQAITARKFASLQKAAEAYIEFYEVEVEVQFDLVAVDHSGGLAMVRYIPNAMVPQW